MRLSLLHASYGSLMSEHAFDKVRWSYSVPDIPFTDHGSTHIVLIVTEN